MGSAATADIVFSDKYDWEWTFYVDVSGNVTHFVQRLDGRESRGDRRD